MRYELQASTQLQSTQLDERSNPKSDSKVIDVV